MKPLIMYIKALFIAYWFHRGQVDKGGNPYWKHPYAVSKRVKGLKRKTVALLHDVPEDTSVTLGDLLRWKFTFEIVDAIYSVTRQENETYMNFIKRAKMNKIGKDVKMADISENLDLKRISKPKAEDFRRAERYQKALDELMREEANGRRKR